MASSDFSPDVPRDFALRLIPAVTADVGRRSDETAPVPSPTLPASRSPDAGGFFGTAFQGLGAFQGLRRACQARLPLGPGRANISTRQASRHATGCGVAPLAQGGYAASAPLVTQQHWAPATWPPGSDHDRTCTGQPTMTYQGTPSCG